MPNKCCKYALVAKVCLKTHPDNYTAIGISAGSSLTDLMSQLRDSSDFRKKASSNQFWFAFAPDGEQDRIVNKSKYVILAKVVYRCKLWDIKNLKYDKKKTPQDFHACQGTQGKACNTTFAFLI